MDDLLESAAREVEELAASVEFDTSELTEDELTALPSLDDGTEDEDDEPAVVATVSTAVKGESASVADDSSPQPAVVRGPAWVDYILGSINRPFAFLPTATRRWVGLIAAITLVTSLLFAVLRPLLFGQRDIIGELRTSAELIGQQRNEAEQRTAPRE